MAVISTPSGPPVADGAGHHGHDAHLIDLPGTEWTVWRDAVLRTTGFPAEGLDRFASPDLAAVADAYLDGTASRAELEAAHAAALADADREGSAIAADPLFREAVTWQNPAMAEFLTRVGQPSPALLTRRQQQRQRGRHSTIASYWQRYCGKNDTIGFFGPVSWATLDPDEPGVRVRCGPDLLRSRHVRYEFWAVQAFADHVAADPVIRPWLPVGPQPHVMRQGNLLLRPGTPPLRLTEAEAALFARCDGRSTAAEIAGGADRDEELAMLAELVRRGVLWWGIDLPQRPDADEAVRSVLAAIPDSAARERALSGLRRLDAALASVGAAAGDADMLATAVAGLDAEFALVTGRETARRPGQMYAGRRLFYEDTVRDIEVTFGRPVLEALAGPLGRVLLPAARWLSVAVAHAYSAAFRSLYDSLRAPSASCVPLDQFWSAALPLVADDARPAGEVVAEFGRRWTALLELDQVAPGTRRVTASSAALAARAARLFAASGPGWPGARIHSPDLHICAPSAAAVARGEFTVVLGEMHAAWPTLDCALFVDRHPHPARLHAAAAADIGRQVRPAYQDWCGVFSPRITTLLDQTDRLLAFSAAPGLDPARLLPVMGLTVTERAGELVVTCPDQGHFALFDVFAVPLAFLTSELFEPGSVAPHSPRITIDNLVAARETWRTTIGESGLTAPGRLPEYLAARSFRHALGLPEKVYVKVKTETKPVYVDWTSPRYVAALCTMLRRAREKAGLDTGIVITEMLPGAEQAWLPDADGRRYFSELRIQLRDPNPPA